MIPTEFTGAWRRHSLTLGDGEPDEPQRVIWIQAGDAFADLRIPVAHGAETNCFAGTTAWNEPRLRWSHDVGLDPPGAADEGDVEWVDGALVETGVFVIDGDPIPYVEVWVREPGSDGECVARKLVEPADGSPGVKGRFVQTGDHSLTVIDRRELGGGVDASYRHRSADGAWTVVFGIGNVIDASEGLDWTAGAAMLSESQP